MRNLVVFYSLEGNTKLIAKTIAKNIEADILELKPQKEFEKEGFKKYFWCGKSVVFNDKPALMPLGKNINDYSNIFIGTPIWAGKHTSPLNTLLNKYTITNKNIALFACHSGGGAKKYFEFIKQIWPNNNYIGEMDFVEPLKKESQESIDKAKMWSTEVMLKNER